MRFSCFGRSFQHLRRSYSEVCEQLLRVVACSSVLYFPVFSFLLSYNRLTDAELPAPWILIAVGTTSIVIAVLIKAPTHRSAKFVFATFVDGTGVDGGVGWSQRASPAYVAVIGILLAQYTLTGYDASAHVSIHEIFCRCCCESLNGLFACGVADV